MDSDQDKEQDRLDLIAAAAKLGLTVETVRKRLQRGRLKGFKLPDGTWRVLMNKQDRAGQEHDPAEGQRDGEQDAAGQEQDKAGQENALIVSALREEIQFLREQLRARDDEIRRIHVLLQQEQQAVKALADQREKPAEQPPAITLPVLEEIDRRVEAAILKVMEAKVEAERSSCPEPEPDSRRRRPWWRRWRG